MPMATSRTAHDTRVPALAAAYRAAEYAWQWQMRWQPLRVGARSLRVEHAFPDATCFGVVSACNPRSEVLSHEENATRDEAQRAAIDRRGWACARSRARGSGGQWEEFGWLIAGITRDETAALARAFGQLGVLHWMRAVPVRLWMLETRPGTWVDDAAVDWLE